MRIADALRVRMKLGEIVDPNLPEGDPAAQRQARREWRRARDAQGVIAKWPEIPRSRLVFGRYWIEDTETGQLYREVFGDPHYARNVVAHYIRSDQSPGMLEPADPPSRAEIERRRAARERRHAEREAELRVKRDRHLAELRAR